MFLGQLKKGYRVSRAQNRKLGLINVCFLTLIPIFCTINHLFFAHISLLQYMRTNVPDVFCGGDLATFPLAMANDRLVNIGHWQMAQAHGNVVTM